MKSWYIKIGLTILAVGYLLHWLAPQKIFETIRTGNALYFLAACALVPVFILLKSIKWHLMARHAGAQESFSTSSRALLVGLGFGLFTPGRAGELMRVQPYESVSKVTLGGLVIVDRLIDLITILFLSAYFFADKVHVLVLFSALAANLALLYSLRNVVAFYKVLPRSWESRGFYRFLAKIGLCSASLTPSKVTLYASISFVIWFVLMIQFYFVINMFQRCEFSTIVETLPVIQFTNLLPITIGGLGVREALSIYVMRPFNIGEQVAAIGAFSIFFINIAIPGLVGLAIFGFSRRV